jgi:hypothetical protein
VFFAAIFSRFSVRYAFRGHRPAAIRRAGKGDFRGFAANGIADAPKSVYH